MSAIEASFGRWLRERIDVRYRTQTEFADAIGKSTSAVSRWLNDKELPKPAQCQLIARAIDQPENLVLERAGHLKPLPEDKTRPDGPHALLRQALALLEQQAGVRVTRPVYGQERLLAVVLEAGSPEYGLPPRTVVLVDRQADRAPDALLCYVNPMGVPRVIAMESKISTVLEHDGWLAQLVRSGAPILPGQHNAWTVLGLVTSVHPPTPLPTRRERNERQHVGA